MQYALELKNVHYAYHTLEGETYALKDITFSVREGEFIALVGPSGCGKSTLLHLIAGLLTPEKGLIKINEMCIRDSFRSVLSTPLSDKLPEDRRYSETSGRSHHTHGELLQIPNSMLKVPVLSG